MMFTVVLLVVLTTTVVSFTSGRAFDGRNAAAKASNRIALTVRSTECCYYPPCYEMYPESCL
uniref:Alpha-conopeptide Fi1.1 n=1 Tax=Conus figulinus TaxID=101301 RepID=A0A075ILT5_CONFI|nr:alpha-conopeptide precursor Fi1.1 [Conus figulinus]